jgi:hypothetical protein
LLVFIVQWLGARSGKVNMELRYACPILVLLIFFIDSGNLKQYLSSFFLDVKLN